MNSEYKINEDGSITRIEGHNSPNQQQNNNNKFDNNNGCTLALLIFFGITIIIAIGLAINNPSDTSAAEEVADTIAIYEAASDLTLPPSLYDNDNISINTRCHLQRMDTEFAGEILVPSFMKYYQIDDNGWTIYYADNGAQITSIILNIDDSPKYFLINNILFDTITYTSSKANWSVITGYIGEYIFYAKAVKMNKKLYVANFVVPRKDKENNSIYRQLTQLIFSSENFPTF